jgi:hypothetical protein
MDVALGVLILLVAAVGVVAASVDSGVGGPGCGSKRFALCAVA